MFLFLVCIYLFYSVFWPLVGTLVLSLNKFGGLVGIGGPDRAMGRESTPPKVIMIYCSYCFIAIFCRFFL